MAICHATFAPSTSVQDYLQSIIEPTTSQPIMEQISTNLTYSHPQALKIIQMSIPREEYLMVDQEILVPRLPIPKSPVDQPAIGKMICTFPDCVAQGDSGANRALTSDRTLLTAFIPITPFPIGTTGPKPIMATHRGNMKLPMVEGLYEGFTTHYSKDSSGSVISPDRHISKSKGRLQRWIQLGYIDSGNGSMIFLDT